MALACVAMLALGITAGPVAVWADDLSGVVVQVDPAGKKMVVMDRYSQRQIDVTFVDQPVIWTTTGKPLHVQNLKRGDGVGIVASGGVARRVMVNQGMLRGVVSRIDLREPSMVVTESGTNRDIEVPLNQGIRIETGQRTPLALKDLKSGDGVGVLYSGEAPIDVVVNSKPPEIKGHIKSIAGDMRSLVVSEMGDGADVTVAITPETTIVSKSGKTLGMNDLRKGDGVGIAHQASVAGLIVVNPVTAP
jgi:hypothetical protein